MQATSKVPSAQKMAALMPELLLVARHRNSSAFEILPCPMEDTFFIRPLCFSESHFRSSEDTLVFPLRNSSRFPGQFCYPGVSRFVKKFLSAYKNDESASCRLPVLDGVSSSKDVLKSKTNWPPTVPLGTELNRNFHRLLVFLGNGLHVFFLCFFSLEVLPPVQRT